jgi:hypothetical protein
MTKNIEPFHILIEIPMALAPIPGDIDRREYREEQIVTAARQAMAGGAKPLKGPLSISLSMSYPPGTSMRKGLAGHGAVHVGSGAVHSPALARHRFCERWANCKARGHEDLRRAPADACHGRAACRMMGHGLNPLRALVK